MIVVVLAVVLLVMLGMNAVLFLILHNAVQTTKYRINEHYVRELSAYDKLLATKVRESEELDERVAEMRKEAESMESIVNALKDSPFFTMTEPEYRSLMPQAHYEDKNFFVKYREAKDLLVTIDKDATVARVREMIHFNENPARYAAITKCHAGLPLSTVYELETVSSGQQLEVLRQCLTEDTAALLEEYLQTLSKDVFSAGAFCTWLQNQERMVDPHIYVYTGDLNDKVCKDDPMVITCYDSHLAEGLRIAYQTQVFDYSIWR